MRFIWLSFLDCSLHIPAGRDAPVQNGCYPSCPTSEQVASLTLGTLGRSVGPGARPSIADCQNGKEPEITSRVTANFVGWEKDQALFDRELEKVIRALRTDEGGREKPPSARL